MEETEKQGVDASSCGEGASKIAGAITPSIASERVDEKQPHILCLDDEESVRLSIRAVLENEYEVTAVETVAEAKAVFDTLEVDALILDIMLKKGDPSGKSYLIDILDEYPDLPVLMLSAKNDTHTVLDCIRLGARTYEIKPFDVFRLRKKVADMLGKEE